MNRLDLQDLEDEQYQGNAARAVFKLPVLQPDKKQPKDSFEALEWEIYEFFKGYKQALDFVDIRGLIRGVQGRPGKGIKAAEKHFRYIQSQLKDPRGSVSNPPRLWLWLMNKEPNI